MPKSKLFACLTPLQKLLFNDSGAFEHLCKIIAREHINDSCDIFIEALRDHPGHAEDVRAVSLQEDFLEAVEKAGWEIRKARNGDFYGIKIEEASVAGREHISRLSQVDIDWPKLLAEHYPNRLFLNTLDYSEEEIVEGDIQTNHVPEEGSRMTMEKLIAILQDPVKAVLLTKNGNYGDLQHEDVEPFLLKLDDDDGVYDFYHLLDALSDQLSIQKTALIELLPGYVIDRENGTYRADSKEDAARQLAEEEGIEPHTNKALEHYIVNDWFGEKLSARGEMVGEVAGLTVWGRCTSGQPAYMDAVIGAVVLEECGDHLDKVLKKEYPSLIDPSPDNHDFEMHGLVLDALEASTKAVKFAAQSEAVQKNILELGFKAPEAAAEFLEISYKFDRAQNAEARGRYKDVEHFIIHDRFNYVSEESERRVWSIDKDNLSFSKVSPTLGKSKRTFEFIESSAMEATGWSSSSNRTRVMTQVEVDAVVKHLGEAFDFNSKSEHYQAPTNYKRRLARLSEAYAKENNITLDIPRDIDEPAPF